MRKMGLDMGTVRIGIALSDPLGILASCYETYWCKTREQDIKHIVEIVKQKQVDKIIVGLPLNMDGAEGKMANYVREFVNDLSKKTTAEIILSDERLSSVEAEEILSMQRLSLKERKEKIDQVAATLILQSYLDRK